MCRLVDAVIATGVLNQILQFPWVSLDTGSAPLEWGKLVVEYNRRLDRGFPTVSAYLMQGQGNALTNKWWGCRSLGIILLVIL